MSYSPVSVALRKSTLILTGFAMFASVPTSVQAAIATQAKTLNAPTAVEVQTPSIASPFAGSTQPGWLIADKKDDKDDKKGRKRGRGRDDDDECNQCQVNLNRAKNLARQAAETANGGIRVYRAENSMHGPAKQCPYVDNGDSWTFTFLGSRPGATTMTTESVVTVYKSSARVVVAYNGAVRTVRQTEFVSFSSSQRTVLVDLVRGTCGCNYLLSDSVRTRIVSQTRSLPPGIQKQLLRGKGLPPGIAKKLIRLPREVNTYINVPTQYELVAIGSNIVLIDQMSYVVDIITYVL